MSIHPTDEARWRPSIKGSQTAAAARNILSMPQTKTACQGAWRAEASSTGKPAALGATDLETGDCPSDANPRLMFEELA